MSESIDLAKYVSRMADTRILVVGDIALDRFVRGDVSRISSESPIPVMVTRQESRMLGQAGNTLANLAGLGAQATILAVIGPDREGELVKGLLQSLNLDAQQLIVNADTCTTIKTRFMAGHQQVFRVDTETQAGCPAKIEDEICARLIKLIPQQQAVILSDYGYGVLSTRVIRTAIETANKAGIPLLVDPRGSDLSKYKGANIATPNRKELAEATGGMPTGDDQQVVAAAEKLMEQSGIQAIVATRSQDGMSIVEASGQPVHLRTEAREVFDVSGAGDTVIATIAAGLATGLPLVTAAGLANIAGGIVVGKVGTSPIRAQEIIDALADRDSLVATTPVAAQARQAAIHDWASGLEQIERWQARGLKIGFTNGCFDILHAGHVNYLNAARAQCDRLVLGLNTDQSVKILKGPNRPVNNQEARATVIGGLGAVDMVMFFGAEKAGDDNTAKALIQHIKPDIYFKGGDYTVETLPEAPVVQAYGGVIKLVDMTEGFSTTSTISRMKSA